LYPAQLPKRHLLRLCLRELNCRRQRSCRLLRLCLREHLPRLRFPTATLVPTNTPTATAAPSRTPTKHPFRRPLSCRLIRRLLRLHLRERRTVQDTDRNPPPRTLTRIPLHVYPDTGLYYSQGFFTNTQRSTKHPTFDEAGFRGEIPSSANPVALFWTNNFKGPNAAEQSPGWQRCGMDLLATKGGVFTGT